MSLLSPFQVEKQKVDDAINVVCERLEHATLLQDRRAAVLSLKGFAREYKETVTAGGLRGLLKSLSIDREDEETLNATLDCLLALFAVDGEGRADDTSFWIADEFTLRPEHTHNLLDIVSESVYYTKIRSLQILACILECRSRQLQECIMNSSTGISALVSVLDDPRDRLRNEGILLLLKLVRGHTEIQKRVAFENAFEKVLRIVEEEGGLQGGIVSADCLSLLSNLLSGNTSNQNWFRETESFKSLTALLVALNKDETIQPATTRNTISLLNLARLFVARESVTRTMNQSAFMKSGFVTQVIGFTFSNVLPPEIRAAAALTLADLVYCNGDIQDYFVKASGLAVTPSGRNVQQTNDVQHTNDVSALFDIILSDKEDTFALRYAVTICLQAFVSDNPTRRHNIVKKVISEYQSKKAGNLLECLLNASGFNDQLRTWFACCTLLNLTHDDDEAQRIMTTLKIGDAEAGEEEVSLIQTVSACLIAALQGGNERASVGYTMLLSAWFFEAPDNVADFLEEGSSLQGIIAALISSESGTILKGVMASLLCLCYAFDFSKTSPLDRSAFREILLRVGREKIHQAIIGLSRSDEVWGQSTSDTFTQPLLATVYTEFFKDNFGLLRNSMDQPARPLVSRREEEVQEAFARSEDTILDLEDELERKSSGLEEAVNIIKTRQEEVARLRDELKYMAQKHAAEVLQLQQEIDKVKSENENLTNKTITDSNQINELIQERNRVIADMQARSLEWKELKNNYTMAANKAENFESELLSEASKRSFLEKELAEIRESTDRNNQEFAKTHDKLALVSKELEDSSSIAKSSVLVISSLNAELASAHSAQRKADSEAAAARTKARDYVTELKGLQQELGEVKARAANSFKNAEEENLVLRQRLASATAELSSTQEQNRHFSKRLEQAEVLRTDLADRNSQVELVQVQNSSLDNQVESLRIEATQMKETLEATTKESRERIMSLEARVASLTFEKTELTKQLDQAQEDLMLLMDDTESGEKLATESDTADS